MARVHKKKKSELRHLIACVLMLLSISGIAYGNETETATSTPINTTNNCNPDGIGTCSETANGDPVATNSPLAPSTNVGNPIDFLTGNKYQREVDLSIPGSSLQLVRHYNSNRSSVNKGFGRGWTHSFEASLRPINQDGVTVGFEVVQSTGKVVRFDSSEPDTDGNAMYRAQSAFDGYIVQPDVNDASNHTWVVPDGRRLSFYGSNLVRIDYPGHQFIKLFYRNGRLSEISDETNRLIAIHYAEPVDGLVEFDSDKSKQPEGHIASVTLPNGSTVVYQYDANKNLSSVRYPDGTSRIYHYEDEIYFNHLTGITDRTGARFATWQYDGMGRGVLSEHAGGKERVTVTYPDMDAADRGELVTTYIENSLGEQSTYSWQHIAGLNRPQLISSAGAGCATCPTTGYSYNYDEFGRLTDAIKVSGSQSVGMGSKSYTYDELSRVVEIRRTDESGVAQIIERREYESDDSLQAIRTYFPSVNPSGERIVEVERNAIGLPFRITESGWSPIVDNGSRLSSGVAAIDTVERWETVERTISYSYDEKQRLIGIDGPRDDVDDRMIIEWDEINRPISVTSPGALKLSNESFNSAGQVTSFSIGNQSPITIKYNGHNRPIEITQYGRSLILSYDAESRFSGYIDPDGKSTTLEYDDAGMLVKITESDGSTTQLKQNSEGQIVSTEQFNRDGTLIKSVSTLFDVLGRVASMRTEQVQAAGNMRSETLQNSYDQSGQKVAISNTYTGQQVHMQYNSMGVLSGFDEPGIEIDDDLSNINTELPQSRISSQAEFDGADNEIAFIDGRGNRTLYIKDDFGQVVVHHSTDTGTTQYKYDLAGNRVRKTDADGDVTHYHWDAASRMIEKITEDGRYTYAYDAVHGKLSESVAPATTERFAYDSRARLITHERFIDDHRFATLYDYDQEGRLFRKTLPDGQTLRYHYVESSGITKGDLATITRETLFGLRQDTLIDQIDLDTRDGTGGYVASNGLRTTRQYGLDGSITAIEIDRVMNLQYEFDQAGRITGIDVNGSLQQYQYGQLGLTKAATGDAVYRFDYDDQGNRSVRSIERNDGAVSATRYDYPARGQGNQLLLETTLSGMALSSDAPLLRHDSRRYSPSGAALYADTFRYEYNAAQRPIKVFSAGKLLAEYAYNGFGERIKKVVYRGDQRKVTYYLYDGNTLTTEVDAEDIAFKQVVFIEGVPVAYLVSQDTYAIHSDHLGTPRMVTDSNGETVWTADYDPFGKATISKNSTLDLPYRFPGQYEDSETGTHYNYFRDYDPATGRYITSDPIGLRGGSNTYAYALNDPLGLTDPLGLISGPGPPPATDDSPAKPTQEDEQRYTDKLKKVLGYAIANLGSDAGAKVEQFLNTMVEEAVFIGVIIAAVVFNPAAAPIVLAGAWLLAGYAAAKFMMSTVDMLLKLEDTDLCDEEELERLGNQLGESVAQLGSEILSGALLGGVGKLGGALRAATEYAEQGAWRLWRSLKARFGEDVTNGGICSFAGETLIVTDSGYKPIKDVKKLKDRVWSRDELTGRMGWRDVVAQYSNRYEETVHVTSIDRYGNRQTIKSNRIHPYFARIAASAILVTASATAPQAVASEGHAYGGDIAGGAWVDAQHLQKGDELLTLNNEWQRVESVSVEAKSLEAYNLTVDEYATYFVAGNTAADAVWVHNTCYTTANANTIPDGFTFTGETTNFGQARLVDENGRELYQGHPPNDNNWYDPTTSPPTESPFVESLNILDSSARSKLDRALGGVTGDNLAAHHVIPLSMKNNHYDLLFKAARGGFDINGANAGMLLGADTHVGGHTRYNDAVSAELALIDPNLSSKETADAVQDIVERLKRSIRQGTFGPWR